MYDNLISVEDEYTIDDPGNVLHDENAMEDLIWSVFPS